MNDEYKGENIIVKSTQDLWDYKSDPAYAKAVANTTEFVDAAIDIMALVIYFTGKSSVAFVRWLRESGTQAFYLGQKVNELYHEKGVDDVIARLSSDIQEKFNEFRKSDETLALDQSSVDTETEILPSNSDAEKEEVAV